MFEVIFGRKSEKFIKKCDEKMRQRLKELFETLKTNPIPAKEYDFKKIGGEEDIYRIRLSSYRVTYFVSWENKQIQVLFIERRKESTYKQL